MAEFITEGGGTFKGHFGEWVCMVDASTFTVATRFTFKHNFCVGEVEDSSGQNASDVLHLVGIDCVTNKLRLGCLAQPREAWSYLREA